ncbi:MAG: electron transport complex subunit RsxC [Clostridia bacterium]|nr:electron transport complex subunit RsxC [Clostridia bacterium]
MRKLTFKHGIHPRDHKSYTNAIPIRMVEPPELLYFPVQQHIGAPLDILVKPGDKVLKGQKLADSTAPVSVPLHSSVSGTVKDVGMYMHASGVKVPTVVVENDGQDTCVEFIEHDDLDALSKEDIIKLIREGGVVGMGGAGFPTHIKLSPPPEKEIRHIIINGSECEPYLTSDHRVMVEEPGMIIEGLHVIRKLFPQADAYVAIEANKPDAIETMKAEVEGTDIGVLTMQTKYPQGAEKQLIYAVTGKEIPSGSLPMDVGCIVINIDTATAIARAVKQGIPLCRRIVTVSGTMVSKPGNFSVRIGTPFSTVIEAAGGIGAVPGKIIMGGPMMGVAGHSLDVPVVKATSSILLFDQEEAKAGEESPCIRCGRCMSACPIQLRPLYLNAYALKGDWEQCQKENMMDCIECGCCSYVCPAKRHLVQSIRVGKQQLAKRK